MTTDIDALIERLEAATGADRELDALMLALSEGRTVRESIHPQFGRQLLARNSRPPHDEYWLDHPAHVSPPVTASIDAALALCERMLPGWVCETLGQDATGYLGEMKGIGWTAEFSNGLNTAQGQAPTLPLAILLALLRAKATDTGTEKP